MNLSSQVQCELGVFVERSFHMQEVTLVSTLVQFSLIGTYPRDSIMGSEIFCIKIWAVSGRNMAGCALV